MYGSCVTAFFFCAGNVSHLNQFSVVDFQTRELLLWSGNETFFFFLPKRFQFIFRIKAKRHQPESALLTQNII